MPLRKGQAPQQRKPGVTDHQKTEAEGPATPLTHGVAPRLAVLFVQELLDNRRCSPRAALHSQLSPQVPAQCGPAPEEHSAEIAVEARNQ